MHRDSAKSTVDTRVCYSTIIVNTTVGNTEGGHYAPLHIILYYASDADATAV